MSAAPASFLGTAVPEVVAGQWKTWNGADWRKGVYRSRNQLYPPDQRFGVLAPGGMCARHLEMRRGYRDMYFDPRKGDRWPGGPSSPFLINSRDIERELAWRRCEWDDKASGQMMAIEDLCLAGTSAQCTEPRSAPSRAAAWPAA